MKIGILGSENNLPSDYYLGNRLILDFDVPVIIFHKNDSLRAAKNIIRFSKKMFRRGPKASLRQIMEHSFLMGRARKFREYQRAFFSSYCNNIRYLAGPEILYEDMHSEYSIERLRKLGIDLLFQNGAGIIRQPLINVSKHGVLNVHHGYLPDVRGVASIAWALLEDKPKWCGVTVHFIDEGIDTGAILAWSHVKPCSGEGYESLFCRATLIGAELLAKTIRQIAEGKQTIIKREHSGVYRSGLSKRDWIALENRLSRKDYLQSRFWQKLEETVSIPTSCIKNE